MSSIGRYELKYFMRYEAAEDLVRAIVPHVVPDVHAQIEGDGIPRYTIRSVYFDNHALKCYHEKVDGMKNRKKLRVRAYSQPTSTDKVFLEIKNRANSQVIKERTLMPLEHVAALLAGDARVSDLVPPPARGGDEQLAYYLRLIPPPARKGAERFAYFCRTYDLEPVVSVIYERTPFVGRDDASVRLTIDVNLRTEDQRGAECLFAPRPAHPVPMPGAILELKFDRLMPEWMRQVVRRFDLRQESISKYCHCVDAVVFKQLEMR